MKRLLGILMGDWSCPYCWAGPYPPGQFTCSNCGRGKNG